MIDPISDTLSNAVRAVAAREGCEIDADALTAVLGVAWSAVAVPSEPDIGNWCLYARDAFLVEAGRLFGLEIRGIHPPEAARGLSGAAEFVQHFDASYRPLIHRALEHGQPVLAWQGWPGALCLAWGVITDPCHDGVGFRGTIHVSPGDTEMDAMTVTLISPPVQLYVVETVTPTRIDPNECTTLALDHARRVLDNALADRFDVFTGPAAFDVWIERLGGAGEADHNGCHGQLAASAGPADVPKGTGAQAARGTPQNDGETVSAGDFGSQRDLPASHLYLTKSLIRGYESVIRFLQSATAAASNADESTFAALAGKCHDVVTAFRETAFTQVGADANSAPDPEAIFAALRQAKAATEDLQRILTRQPSDSPTR